MKLLHIDSSILGEGSASRRLSAAIVAAFARAVPDLEIVRRDLDADPIPHLDSRRLPTVRPANAPQGATGVPDDKGAGALDELLAADIVVIGAPMYNFALSTQLKSWIDRIVVAGKTFKYTATGPQGLVHGKRVIVAISRGGVYPENAPFEHAESYLKVIFGFIGVTDLTFVRAEGLMLSPEHRQKGLDAALAAIPAARAA